MSILRKNVNRILFFTFLIVSLTVNIFAQELKKPVEPGKPTEKYSLIILLDDKGSLRHSADLINKLSIRHDPAFLNRFGNPQSAKYLISRRRQLGETDNTLGLSPEEIEKSGVGDPDFSVVHPESSAGLLQRYVELIYDSASSREAAEKKLAVDSNIVSVSKPFQFKNLLAPLVPNDTEFYRQWGVSDAQAPAELNIESAWNRTRGHAYVGIADAGIPLDLTGSPTSNPNYGETTHPDLADNYRKHFSEDFVNNDDFPESHVEGGLYSGHGTHVAGIIGASTNNNEGVAGICWDCSLSMAKRINSSATNEGLNNSAPAYNFLTEIGVQAVNSSFGDRNVPEGVCAADPSNFFCVVLRFMDDRDIINVAASGNVSSTSRIDFPASEPNVIAVGAVQRNGSRANFSDYSSLLDLAAPGVGILSSFDLGATWHPSAPWLCGDSFSENDIAGQGSPPVGSDLPSDGYGSCTGTSMAAPHITGVVSLMRSTDPLLIRSDIKDALIRSAPYYPVKDSELGHGVPDAAAAVDKVLGTVNGSVISNRLTPLFSFYSYSGGEDSLYTTVPQMGYPAIKGTLPPQPGGGGIWYSPSYGSNISHYADFPHELDFGPFPTPMAEVYIFTTDKNPITLSQPLVPLYRMSFQGPNGANTNNIDHVYTTEQSGINAYKSVGYQLDGIEGYIFDDNYAQPAGTERLYRRYNSARDDHAIFPESKLSQMTAAGYTQLSGNSYIGYVYLNTDADNDHLIDGFERAIGTCLNDNDTDNDGIIDGDEVLGYPRTDPVSTVVSCDNPSVPEYPWQDNATGTLYTNRNWNYALGYHFTPQVNGTINQLGGYFNGTKVVKLFNKTTGALLAQTTVSAGNNWAYSSITPVTVQAGVQYTVAVYMAGSGGSYRNVGSGYFPRTFDNVRIDATTYASTSSNPNARPTISNTIYMYGQADIRFTAQ